MKYSWLSQLVAKRDKICTLTMQTCTSKLLRCFRNKFHLLFFHWMNAKYLQYKDKKRAVLPHELMSWDLISSAVSLASVKQELYNATKYWALGRIFAPKAAVKLLSLPPLMSWCKQTYSAVWPWNFLLLCLQCWREFSGRKDLLAKRRTKICKK